MSTEDISESVTTNFWGRFQHSKEIKKWLRCNVCQLKISQSALRPTFEAAFSFQKIDFVAILSRGMTVNHEPLFKSYETKTTIDMWDTSTAALYPVSKVH